MNEAQRVETYARVLAAVAASRTDTSPTEPLNGGIPTDGDLQRGVKRPGGDSPAGFKASTVYLEDLDPPRRVEFKRPKILERTAAHKPVGGGYQTLDDYWSSSTRLLITQEQRERFSDQQQEVLQAALDGSNVFITGTGKSHLLREIVHMLREKHPEPGAVIVTATTGVAACNIGGITIHGFAGLSTNNVDPAKRLSFVKSIRRLHENWKSCRVLIIDEIGMLPGELLSQLVYISNGLSTFKSAPFGDRQLICCGDFLQLPPVFNAGEKGFTQYAFESPHWSKLIERMFNLTRVYRQTDRELVAVLDDLRWGVVTQQAVDLFRRLRHDPGKRDGVEPVLLFPLVNLAVEANLQKLQTLPGEEHTFKTVTRVSPGAGGFDVSRCMHENPVPDMVVLKVGAQVMLTKNITDTYVNGSLGEVVRFCTYHEHGSMLARTTVADPIPPPGPESVLYPLVRFSQTGRLELVTPHSFTFEDARGRTILTRNQLPLILAWALTIHRAQGQTLPNVAVHLSGAFASGHVYVAISRAAGLLGLQVTDFLASLVKADPRVVNWLVANGLQDRVVL